MSAPFDVPAARARADAATDGPWYVDDEGVCSEATLRTTIADKVAKTEASLRASGDFDEDSFSYEVDEDIAICVSVQDRWEAENPADMDFIAAARTDVPALCDEVERLRAQIARVEALCDGYQANDGFSEGELVARDIRAALAEIPGQSRPSSESAKEA